MKKDGIRIILWPVDASVGKLPNESSSLCLVGDNREGGEKASTPNSLGNDDGEATISAAKGVTTSRRRAPARDAGGGRDFEHMMCCPFPILRAIICD